MEVEWKRFSHFLAIFMHLICGSLISLLDLSLWRNKDICRMKVVILKRIKCKWIDHIKSQGLPLFELGNCTLQCRNPLCNISPCICLLIIIIVCSSISDLLCYYPYQVNQIKSCFRLSLSNRNLGWFGLGQLGRLVRLWPVKLFK